MADNSTSLRLWRQIPFFKREEAAVSDRIKDERRLGWVFWAAFSYIMALILLTISTNFLPYKDPAFQDYGFINSGLSAKYWFGGDALGRDIFSRVIHGAGISFSVAFTSPFIGMAIGLLMGMSAGYFRGRVDTVVSIIVDSILAFPNIVLAIAVLFFAGPTLPNLILVIAFYTIPQFTRIARANTLLYAQREFVMAARAQGASHLRILIRELLPNVIIPLAAFSLLVMSFTIILEGTLSFLGVGIPPPTPTWGRMISEGVEELVENAWIAFVPSIFMFLTILSLNLMGDRLRQFTDVKASNA
ncbi:MAG: ABC transporter permease [Proteobacteria bacterium]|nr:ABC transporter permease [Pseudomonadota bacterium]